MSQGDEHNVMPRRARRSRPPRKVVYNANTIVMDKKIFIAQFKSTLHR